MIKRFVFAAFTGFLAASFAASNLPAAVDPTLLNLVPSDAKILYGVDVQQTLASPLGKFMYARVAARNPALEQFGPVSGFDPKRDVRELLFVATNDAVKGKMPRYDLILARGTFRLDRFQNLAGLTRSAVSEDHKVTIITPPSTTMHSSIALLDASTVAIGPIDVLKALIARRAGNLGNSSGPLAKKAMEISASNDTWFATVTPFSELGLSPRSSLPAPLLDVIRESSGGMKFIGDSVIVSADAVARSEREAQTLTAMLTGAVQLIKNPRVSPLQQARFSSNGSVIHATLSIPERDVERLLVRPNAMIDARSTGR